MGHKQNSLQESISSPILDKDLEKKLLASNLVNKIKHYPDYFNITLTGEGITHDLPQLFLTKDTNKFDFHTYSYDNKKTIYTICKYKKQ